MFNLKCASLTNSGNNIKTNGSIDAEMLDVSISSHHNVAYLLPIDGILRFNVVRITAGFYLHYNQVVRL